MSATPKKPVTPGNNNGNPSRPTTNRTPTASSTNSTAAPSRSPSRMGPTTNTASNAATGVNRTKSVRNGAPVSARAAIANRKPHADSDMAAEDAKAEMQARMEELHERLQQAEQTVSDTQKQATILQLKLDESLKEQGMLEESVHEHTERVEELENERKESLRARREFEQIYEAERAASMKEREGTTQREEEMQTAMHRMKESLAQRELRAGVEESHRPSMSRTSSFRSNNASPNPEAGGQFAPPSLQRSDSRSRSKLVMQKDKVIEDLRLELAEAQMKIVELQNMGGGQLLKLQKELYEIKIQNARLMEENESFQLLLSEKTLNGDFAHSDLLRPSSISGSRPPSRQPNAGAGTSLADELASEADSTDAEGADNEQARKLQNEVNSLKDQNKALTLYINNIISRLLQSDQFEQILDKTPDLMAGPHAASMKLREVAASNVEKELPPPPPLPEKDEVKAAPAFAPAPTPTPPIEQPQGFLQRAKSVMGARRGRPMSQAVSSADQEKLQHQLRANEEAPKAHENPETAPRIPINRSNSSRGNSGHRRANSDWPAASVVTSMYRGPSPSLQGPVSPGLTSPVGRNGFFAVPQPLGGGGRVPSGSTVPTISEAGAEKENEAPGGLHRDSKISNPASHRSSVISNSGDHNTLGIGGDMDYTGSSSGPSSPPRSTTSSGDRETRSGGAIMMGSKPRPLRLVQTAAAEDESAKKAAKRGSWFGWMGSGAPPPPGVGRSISGGAAADGQAGL